jgi:hypothetical protein
MRPCEPVLPRGRDRKSNILLRRCGYFLAILPCFLLSNTGCGGTQATELPSRTLSAISISPATFSLMVGGTQQLTATAVYSDGSKVDVGASVSWISSNNGIATVNLAGMVTAAAAGAATITANLAGQSGSAALTVPTLISVSITPSNAALTVGGTQQLTATATYSDGSAANITSSAAWTSSSSTIAAVNSNGLITTAAAGHATITATFNTQSGTTTLVVGANVLTWHSDNQRSGLNAGEGVLTPQNVSSQTFGKLYSYVVDGYIYAQSLFVSNVTINGSMHNVVFVATENDSVYALDSDNYGSGSPLWQVSLLQSGETPITNASIQPYLGVTSTPAIDLTSNTMYVVSTETSSTHGGTFRLHALDITSGAEKFGGPVTIQASVPGTNSSSVNGVVHLTTSCLQRAALLAANGSVFIGFGSCQSGWLLAYDAQSLAQTGVFNASPNLNGEGTYRGAGGVWMGGGGPVADDLGNIYITTGNGPYDGQTAFGDSVLKFDSTLNLLDHFTPYDYQYMDCSDKDLAAGGLLLIPGSTQAVAGGKSGKLYLVNTSELGGMQANDAGATQTLWFESDQVAPYADSCTDSLGVWTSDINSYEIFATSAFFNGSIYLGITPTLASVPAPLRQFSFTGTLTPGTSTSDSILENSYGTTPFISAAGTASGIVWMIDHGQPVQTAVTASSATLRAFDASNLSLELYDSSQNSADVPGYGIKFTSPIVANGKVFIGTAHDPVTTSNPQGELDIYGLKN